ncbi:hypothetical protein EW026_g5757 [Hermanssonia centrifuga]|nr:hypothetical protein EW026_g5757 [Hermanssonia centrifuga]
MYKPAKEIYEGLLSYVNSDGNNKSNGQSVSKEQIWLVSGNPFDVTGARSAGLNAIWVDRADKGWKDRADEYKPSKVVNGLLEIVDLMEKNE